MRVARALANMLRAAWHDPIWAIMAIVTMPFLAFWPVIGGAALVLLLGFDGVGLSNWLTRRRSTGSVARLGARTDALEPKLRRH